MLNEKWFRIFFFSTEGASRLAMLSVFAQALLYCLGGEWLLVNKAISATLVCPSVFGWCLGMVVLTADHLVLYWKRRQEEY